MDNLPPIAIRSNRIQAAVALNTPDRVPFMPTMNNYYALEYGVTIQDAMTDPACLMQPLQRFLDSYDPDLLYSPCFFPIAPMEFSGYTAARWPGTFYNLPPNTPYQYIDKQYLEDEDWDDFMKDPTRFIMKRILPQKHTAFQGIELLDMHALCGQAIYSLAGLGIPSVKNALMNMIKTGELVLENLGKVMQLNMMAIEHGFPVFGAATGMCPFDDFADQVRGLLTTCMDIVTDPELVCEAIDRWGDVIIPNAITNAKMQHAQYLFIPLHCGTDDFMSLANYQKCYWPGLKRMIMAAIDAEITPVVLCEGKYYTRLETIADVPKGKVIYVFENTDFAEAKRVLGDVACIGGGMPTEYLMRGDKQRVIDETKRIIDICAPGGGFIMSNSLALDQVKTENMDAWKETVFTYGKY